MSKNGRLDVLLLNPGGRIQTYQSLGEKLTAVESPVWAGLMATFALNKGLSVHILDAEAEELAPWQVAERVKEIAPLLVVVVVYGHQPSASTQNMTTAGATCTAIKQRIPEVKVLLVGGHVAALPQRTLQEEDADFVSGDEGLYTISDLVQALKSGHPNELSKVRGLWYREGGPLRSNAAAPLLRDLDKEMPGTAWDLLPMDKYRAHNWHCFGHLQREPYAALYTTLGCPYHCSFCCIQAPFKSGEKEAGLKESVNSYRFWNPEMVIAQIDTLVDKYSVRNIKIADEMFVLNRRHVNGICDLIIERRYDLNIWAYARVDTVKEGMTEKLKKAGFNWLAFGIETANERVQKSVDKRFEQDEVYKTIEEVQAAGINVIGNFIFGLPEDDLQSMQETLDLALDLNCEFANFYSAMAYPGSPLYNFAVKEGWPLPEKWSGYSQHAVDTLPLPTKHVSASEVLRFRDHAFQVYFTSPRYLDMVTRKFGAETTQHIKEMTSHRLERRYA
ncbi:radical SAM protein [Acidobacteria bacterium AH-259-A15]|nr:radical SAM protein [Acidobacteria bacterium AH-259-A15]